jgi:hypothetical protein
MTHIDYDSVAEVYDLYVVEKDAFEQMATEAGFRVAGLCGSYDRAPFDPERSPVMIWWLEKGA